MSGGVPAHDLAAERVVISAAVLYPQTLPEIVRWLRPEDLYDPRHRAILDALYALDTAGKSTDLEAVGGHLISTGKAQAAGGIGYLAEVVDATPATTTAHDYARTLATLAAVRRVDATCRVVAGEARSGLEDARAWLDGALARVAEAATAVQLEDRDPMATAAEVADETRTEIAARAERGAPGISTGFRSLDWRLGRLRRRSLHILAARPGIGKTGLALQIACNVARSGIGVVFVSLETDRTELLERQVAEVSSVPTDRIYYERLTAAEQKAITDALSTLGALPLVIDDATQHTLATLRGAVRRARARLRHPVGLLVVDYMQLVKTSQRKGANRSELVGEVSHGLLAMAKDLDIAVLALSQLNRSSEARNVKDKRPQLSDLRESGDIEQDARAVVMLHREDIAVNQGPCEAIVRKARGGGHPGTTEFVFTRSVGRFAETSKDEPPERYREQTHWSDSADDWDTAGRQMAGF
jgi:replicative DNA helicase